MIDERALIGWLCIMRHNLDRQTIFNIPTCIREGLAARGWVELVEWDEEDGDVLHNIHVTDQGTLVSDLAAPEWGIDPVGVGDLEC